VPEGKKVVDDVEGKEVDEDVKVIEEGLDA
jgi:hypothetical protein